MIALEHIGDDWMLEIPGLNQEINVPTRSEGFADEFGCVLEDRDERSKPGVDREIAGELDGPHKAARRHARTHAQSCLVVGRAAISFPEVALLDAVHDVVNRN